ncbi:MAG TPA: methyltransferase domain-containing protein [Acidobacteriota bacterium]|nr:methyltransferase domain-containing protein [Acidobacteriota bacterium]
MQWKEFFRYEAEQYDSEPFTQATEREVAFLIEQLKLPKGASILDVGCGTGRHSVALAQHGFAVTGIDLSDEMLEKARARATASKTHVTFLQSDATTYVSEPVFDAAIGLCEGAMGLLGQGDDPIERDLTVLRNMHAALKPDGQLIVNALNVFRVARKVGHDEGADTLDVMSQTTLSTMVFETPKGPVEIPCRERMYTPTEFTLMLRVAGFAVEDVWGGTAGNWRREPMDLDEYELMAVARKK